MREIKFRAWAEKTTNNRWNYAYPKAKEKYLNKLSSLNIDELDADLTEEEIREKYFAEFDALNIEPETLSKEMISDITVNGEKVIRPYGYKVIAVMQFTGLLDKNGKEIYEGDIVNLSSWEPSVYKVAWDRGAFYIAKTDGEEVGDIKYVEQSEIIGNIYSTPELLESNKN